MIETPRGIAVEILNRVELTDAYAEPLLDAYLSLHYLPNIHDRRLLTQLVYGVLRMQGNLDWLIGKLYRGRVATLSTVVNNIIRTGLYQLIYTNRIPVFAVVDEAVKLTKALRPESASLVNAILRTYIRKRDALTYPRKEDDPLEYIAAVHSHPRWLVKRWLKILGVEGTTALCMANNEIPPVVLRANRLKATREHVITELKEEGIESNKTTFSPEGLVISGHGSLLRNTRSYEKGHIQLQDEASQLIAHLLSPQPGDHVLDICAGGGVKTTHLAEIMKDRGKIVAIDINENKLASLKGLTARLGITIVETKAGDAAAGMETSWYERADRILVDAPCSGLGTLRRNPEIKWRTKAGDSIGLSLIQKKILNGAASHLKQGGSLVYSVCTVMPEENERVVEDFLGRNSDFKLAPPPGSIDRSLIDEKGFFRTSPERHGTDGFFAALMIKTGQNSP
jgi:16S rRNA (cytosine967-C5)-methyltransferase